MGLIFIVYTGSIYRIFLMNFPRAVIALGANYGKCFVRIMITICFYRGVIRILTINVIVGTIFIFYFPYFYIAESGIAARLTDAFPR